MRAASWGSLISRSELSGTGWVRLVSLRDVVHRECTPLIGWKKNGLSSGVISFYYWYM